MKKCPNCGTKNADSAKQCNFCEATLPDSKVSEIKKSSYVHNESAEKKRENKSKFMIGIVIVSVVCVLALILAVIFSGSGESKNEKVARMLTDSMKSGSQITGTIKGVNLDLVFKAEFKDDYVIVTYSGGEYDSLFISEDGMILERDRVDDRKTLEVTKDMELYKLYVAYVTLKNVSKSEKNVLNFDTADIKNTFLPPIKNAMSEDFDETFIEENFVSAIGSVLMIFGSDPDLESFMGIKLPKDVNNSEISFKLSSYDMQNEILSKFKKAYKNQSDYDAINQRLKDAKSNVKDGYKAKGTFKTENGKLVSATSDITYKGYKYTLTLSFE